MERVAYESSTTLGNENWYYIKNGRKLGPVNGSKLSSMLASGDLPQDTKVWTSGMDGWINASETQLLSSSSEASSSTEKQTQPKKKSRKWVWLVVFLLLAAVAAACYFLFFNKDKTDSPDIEEPTYKLENTVVFENDECAFIIDTIGEKGNYLEVDVRCVNKTDDPLHFTWENTCINGCMFDPLWNVDVVGNTTMKSSITLPLDKLDSYGLLPVDQLNFVLQVYNESEFAQLMEESSRYIVLSHEIGDGWYSGEYKQVDGYDGYLFTQNVQVDEDGRPYYVNNEDVSVYFDEIFDQNGHPLYPVIPEKIEYKGFYDDAFGRPYYFNESCETVYYEGFGFAFYDTTFEKYYYYDENGNPAYYGNDGVPEYYEGEVPKRLLEAGMPERLAKAGGSYVVHKEYMLFPTGKQSNDVTRPKRLTTSQEKVYWNGEKGSFIVLGGEMDDFTGYIVHTYVENSSDQYILIGWSDVVVNGVEENPASITILRPHSNAYTDIIIPAKFLKDNKIKSVERIDFSVLAVGENLSVPLYPIQWTAQ